MIRAGKAPTLQQTRQLEGDERAETVTEQSETAIKIGADHPCQLFNQGLDSPGAGGSWRRDSRPGRRIALTSMVEPRYSGQRT